MPGILLLMDTLKRIHLKEKSSLFKKLEEIVDIASLSKEERMKYDESIKRYRDTMAVMEGNMEEGIAKGRAEGIAKGKAEGRAEGKAEVARNLKSIGIPIDQITMATGLSKEEIEKL